MAIVWVLLLLLAAVGGLLFIPLELAVSAGTAAGVRLRLRWLFGAVRLSLTPLRRRDRTAEKRPRRRSRRAGALRGWRTARRLIAIDGLAGRVATLAREASRAFRWRWQSAFVRAGLGDPADTGELCGFVGAVLGAFPAADRFRFEPDFDGMRFEAYAEGSGRIIPARAALAVARFAVSRPGRRAIGAMLWSRGR
jgi:DUF2953 family protein